ncbi:MAG: HlyD family efflux transporter periplasmic adaptor subunit [Kiritimatiellae bacterium]|nr:HlyD family efflux transporter periplasmic adaptor subunit [Kiritimatiellia bacterium]
MIRSKLFWILIIFILATGASVWYWRHTAAGDDTLYTDIRVKRGDLQIMVMTTGTVKPQNRLEIKSPIAGRVEEVLVKEGAVVHTGQIIAWMSSTERAALLDAARAKGTNALAYWEQLYKPTPLVAPLDGDIIARNIEPGQTVTASDALYVMSDRLIIEATVDETDIGMIAVGQSVNFTLDAYPQDAITGKVDHIAYEAKTVNNVTTYTVEVLPLVIPAFLRSGMTANLKILTVTTNDVLLIPTDAVSMENKRSVVLQPGQSADDPPITVPVTIGLSNGKQVEIKGGLDEGDIVLVKSLLKASAKDNDKRNPFMPSRPRR